MPAIYGVMALDVPPGAANQGVTLLKQYREGALKQSGNMGVTLLQELDWPNRFSRFIGDKVFGLLVADLIGLDVPRATVLARRIGPFVFGRRTGSRDQGVAADIFQTALRGCA